MASLRSVAAVTCSVLAMFVLVGCCNSQPVGGFGTRSSSMTPSDSVSSSATPSPSFCPSCTPFLNVTVASDQCGATGQCGTRQCSLEVDIRFDYLNHLNLPGDQMWGNILASSDCKTWWHTGSSQDLFLHTSGMVNVSDGCYGGGDASIVVLACVSQYQYSATAPRVNCINNNPSLSCPAVVGRCVTVKAAPSPASAPASAHRRRLADPTSLPCCKDGVWMPEYAPQHIPACGASNTNEVAIIVSVVCVGVVVVGFVSCKVYLRRKEAAGRRRKEMIRCLQAEHIDIAGREFLLSDSYWTDSERSRSGSGASSRGGSFATIDTDPSIVSDRGE